MNWQNVINSLNAEALRIGKDLNKSIARITTSLDEDFKRDQLLKMDIYTVLARALAEGLHESK